MTLPSYVSIASFLPIVVRSAIDATYDQIGSNVDLTLNPDGASGTPPFTDAWDLDNGETSSDQSTTVAYDAFASYDVACTVAPDLPRVPTYKSKLII